MDELHMQYKKRKQKIIIYIYSGISKNYNYEETETQLILAQDKKQGTESTVISNSHTKAFCRKNYGYLVLKF
jgi:hypothetical protein